MNCAQTIAAMPEALREIAGKPDRDVRAARTKFLFASFDRAVLNGAETIDPEALALAHAAFEIAEGTD